MFELMLVGQIGGLAILLGVFILLFKRIVFLDTKTKQPTSFEFPLLGRVKTQTPLVIPILLGAVLLLYPIAKSERLEIDTKEVRGVIEGALQPARVFFVGQPGFVVNADRTGHFSTYIPVLRKKMTYYVLALDSTQYIGDVTIDDSHDWQKIKISFQPPPSKAATTETAKEATEKPTKREFLISTSGEKRLP